MKYTDNPNEVNTENTVPSPADVIALLRAAWPELTDAGARTLTAQFIHETGGGRYCFNWNLGNVKATADQPHMFLRNVWELLLPESAAAEVKAAGGLAHIATPEERSAHGWTCPSSKVVVVFQPPHFQCRFRAYDSLADGAQRWVAAHQRIARAHADYVKIVNSGDCKAVAHTLAQVRYYTGDEGAYARSMTAAKSKLDATLHA